MRTVVKSTTLHCLSKSQSKIESPALLSLTTGFTSIESAALIIIIIIAMNVLFSFFVVEVFWHFLHCVQGVLREGIKKRKWKFFMTFAARRWTQSTPPPQLTSS